MVNLQKLFTFGPTEKVWAKGVNICPFLCHWGWKHWPIDDELRGNTVSSPSFLWVKIHPLRSREKNWGMFVFPYHPTPLRSEQDCYLSVHSQTLSVIYTKIGKFLFRRIQKLVQFLLFVKTSLYRVSSPWESMFAPERKLPRL
jgi:hypothetical protein